MDLWLRLRLLELRTCKQYKACSIEAALKNYKYTPCYYCMGGAPMPQTFHCLNPSCRTMWVEDSNAWVITKKASCPFCHRLWDVQISLGKDIKPHGILIGTPYEPL